MQRMYISVIIAIAVLSSHPLYTAASTERRVPCLGHEPLSLEEVREKLESVREFLAVDLGSFAEDSVELTVDCDDHWKLVKTRLRKRDDRTWLAVDNAPKDLSVFHSSAENVPEGLSADAAVGPASLVPRANLFLSLLGLDLRVGENDCSFSSGGNVDSGSLGRARWRISKSYEYAGIPYAFRRVRLSFSAYTGRVCSYTHRPPSGVPESMEVYVSAEEAKEVASSLLRSLWDFEIPEIVFYSDARLEIMVPEDKLWYTRSNVPQNLSLLDEPRQVWSMALKEKREGRERAYMIVHVDCLTGEVVAATR